MLPLNMIQTSIKLIVSVLVNSKNILYKTKIKNKLLYTTDTRKMQNVK